MTSICLKRAYDEPGKTDGQRILIDRLWPRGVSRDKLALDGWMKDLAPSDGLRKWFDHDPDRWEEFQARYARELNDREAAVGAMRDCLARGRVTLVYGARDREHNNAVVLKAYLLENG
ncbi:MAG: DUF488 domain-containing protein [Jhaorihella sp.]